MFKYIFSVDSAFHERKKQIEKLNEIRQQTTAALMQAQHIANINNIKLDTSYVIGCLDGLNTAIESLKK